jgi:hypothetical protein
MKKEAKSTIIKPSEMVLQDKIKQREQIRQEFLLKQKEKYKKNTNKRNKKEIISQLKEVYAGES